MSHAAPSATLGAQRKLVARMLETAAPFIEVERAIAHSLLPGEQKTELWTLAWSLLGPQRQEQQIQWIIDRAAAYHPAS